MWLISKISDYLAEGDMTEEDRSVIWYGLERIIENLMGCLILVIAGCCFGSALRGLLLWIFLYPLRSSAGGYHAATRGRCILISAMTVFVAFAFQQEFRYLYGVHVAICVISAFVIWCLAPVGSRNKPLDEKEKRYYRKRVRHILLFELFLAVFAGGMQWMDLFGAVELAWLIVGVSVLIGNRMK